MRDASRYLAWLAERRRTFYPEVEAQVRAILERVRREGDAALHDYTEQFDKVSLRSTGFEVPKSDWAQLSNAVDVETRQAIHLAVSNIAEFHRRHVPESWFYDRPDGSRLGQVVSPMDRVGVYIPGGAAPLFSSLLFIVVAARVAGVKEVILCTPSLPPEMLYAAGAAGVDRIFRLGGAQAVAAMAYGTESVPAVDKVVGPGNLYVVLAKKLVFGPVGIDMLAGPTESLIIDDGSEPVEWLAADMLSQTEHPGGMVILVTTAGEGRVQAVNAAMAAQAARLPGREVMEENARELGAALLAPDLQAAAAICNAVAPEHAVLAVADPWALLPAVRHAATVFLGAHTPEVIGDYVAGPSNVIPTEGTPRYASPVGVETFLKRSAVVAYSRRALQAEAPAAIRMAEAEGLPAHANSLQVRRGSSA